MKPLPPPGRLVKVTLRLDADVLDQLDTIVTHRRGSSISRAQLVREACSWLLAKEAAWLHRHHAQERERQRRAAEDARTSAERDADRRAAERDVIESALTIARSLERPSQPPRRPPRVV